MKIPNRLHCLLAVIFASSCSFVPNFSTRRSTIYNYPRNLQVFIRSIAAEGGLLKYVNGLNPLKGECGATSSRIVCSETKTFSLRRDSLLCESTRLSGRQARCPHQRSSGPVAEFARFPDSERNQAESLENIPSAQPALL